MKKNILIMALFGLALTSESKANQACDTAWDNLISVLAMYGGFPISPLGQSEIANAQAAVVMACESEVFSGGE